MLAHTAIHEARQEYRQAGFTVLSGLFDHDEIRLMKKRVDQAWMNELACKRIVQNQANPVTSLFQPIRMDFQFSVTKDLVLQPKLFEALEKLFESKVLIVGSTCFFKAPGEKKLPLHQDQYDIGAYPEASFAAWISLDDADPENGGLIMAPETHREGLLRPSVYSNRPNVVGMTFPLPENKSLVDIVTAPGDVVVFDGLLLHGSHSNISPNRFRRSIVIQCARESIESIFVNHDNLFSRNGRRTVRKMNKRHSLYRHV
ncbi:phytanoyl-CoA dioxygenase family protein [Cohnella soli]|uniref:Phytanoyl-CoA dioxygenase family protein n=1 Tax=Cohnella soli TaxID=425005 RepID=A0ABW0I4L5_9BACL